MALSPDGGTAYIANSDQSGARDRRRCRAARATSSCPTVSPSDVAIAPDGRTVYLAGCKPICTPGLRAAVRHRERSASRSRSRSTAIRTASRSHPNGARAYTANLSGPSVSVIDLAANRAVATVPVPVQPTGLAVSADSATVWVASQTGGALTAIDAATNQVRGSAPIALARDVVVTPGRPAGVRVVGARRRGARRRRRCAAAAERARPGGAERACGRRRNRSTASGRATGPHHPADLSVHDHLRAPAARDARATTSASSPPSSSASCCSPASSPCRTRAGWRWCSASWRW